MLVLSRQCFRHLNRALFDSAYISMTSASSAPLSFKNASGPLCRFMQMKGGQGPLGADAMATRAGMRLLEIEAFVDRDICWLKVATSVKINIT